MRSLRGKDDVFESTNHKNSHQNSLAVKTLTEKEKSKQKSSRQGSDKLEAGHDLLRAKIFIGGIPSNFTQQDLLDYFQTFGEVLAIKLKTKKKNANVNLGFGTISVTKPTAEKILEANFHYIQGRKVECQRFVKCKKSKSELIKDKKLRTLYIIEPPESINERNLKTFLEKFGKIENCYILPERKVPVPAKPSQLGDDSVCSKSDKYDFLKKKALILFETSETARAAYQKSHQGKLIIQGFVIKLAYKWPDQVKKILRERKKLAREELLKRQAEEEGQIQQDLLGEINMKTENLKSGGLMPIPVFDQNQTQKAIIDRRDKLKSQQKEKILRNSKKIESERKSQYQELTQAELLDNLPDCLKRDMSKTRPRYFQGFWGNIIQRLEEHRRLSKPGKAQYKHADHDPLHSGLNIQINMKNKAERRSVLSFKNANSIFSLLTTFPNQFERSNQAVFTKGSSGNLFGF